MAKKDDTQAVGIAAPLKKYLWKILVAAALVLLVLFLIVNGYPQKKKTIEQVLPHSGEIVQMEIANTGDKYARYSFVMARLDDGVRKISIMDGAGAGIGASGIINYSDKTLEYGISRHQYSDTNDWANCIRGECPFRQGKQLELDLGDADFAKNPEHAYHLTICYSNGTHYNYSRENWNISEKTGNGCPKK